MNNVRRKRIDKVSARIEKLVYVIEELREEISSIIEDEREAADNVPKNFQKHFNYEFSEIGIDTLEETDCILADVYTELDEAVSTINDAWY